MALENALGGGCALRGQRPVAGVAKQFAGYIANKAFVFNDKNRGPHGRTLSDCGPPCRTLHIAPQDFPEAGCRKGSIAEGGLHARGISGLQLCWRRVVPFKAKCGKFSGIVSASGKRAIAPAPAPFVPDPAGPCAPRRARKD